MNKTALITGISGQDGSYLAEYLLGQEYQVWGLARRPKSTFPREVPIWDRVQIAYGDLRDEESLAVAINKIQPDELYNLGAQVFVPLSWRYPDETFDINAGGLARILKVIEVHGCPTKVYQASTSEMFGNQSGTATEETPFRPNSPYGASKVAAHHLVEVYRQKGLFVVGGILFNHESPRRGPEMVTQKVVRAAVAWYRGNREPLWLGNLDSRRDWGFTGDYVQAMHRMLNQTDPRDYIIGTGVSRSVRELVVTAMDILQKQTGEAPVFDEWVKVDPKLVRKVEIDSLKADSRKAKADLSWQPWVSFRDLIGMMIEEELKRTEPPQASAAAK